MTHLPRSEAKINLPLILLILAFAVDLLTPWLIHRGRIPGATRWISQAILVAFLFWAILRMLAFDRIPAVFWLAMAISAITLVTATFNGQGLPITLWGWWLMFQFPMLGLFAGLHGDWPEDFPRLLLLVCVAILGFEVLLQIYQYLRGTPPGDHLSGTFGRNGTGNLVLFLILVLCFSLGEWLAKSRWIPVGLTLAFGTVSSTLGEMKLFLPVTFLLGLLTSFIYILKGKDLWKLIPIGVVFIAILLAFLSAYNAVVPEARQVPLEDFLSDPEMFVKYMNASTPVVSGQNVYTDIGRNFAIRYGWNEIRQDPIKMFFGEGLGARAESSTFGFAGRALVQGSLGLSTGTSLLVIMHETGLMGFALLLGLIVSVVFNMARAIRQNPGSPANGLRYGMILFTLLWPVWIWYNTAWVLRAPMMLYWTTLGYLVSEYRAAKTAPARAAQSGAASELANQHG